LEIEEKGDPNLDSNFLIKKKGARAIDRESSPSALWARTAECMIPCRIGGWVLRVVGKNLLSHARLNMEGRVGTADAVVRIHAAHEHVRLFKLLAPKKF
jgi:hypothetical protein